MNMRALKALGLEGQPVVSITIKFDRNSVPTAEVIFDLGMNGAGEGVMRELRRYELVERITDE